MGNQLLGVAVRDSLDKTVKIRVETRKSHPRYKKIVKIYTSYLVHDELNRCKKGDQVTITSCRPLSKCKTWKINYEDSV